MHTSTSKGRNPLGELVHLVGCILNSSSSSSSRLLFSVDAGGWWFSMSNSQ